MKLLKNKIVPFILKRPADVITIVAVIAAFFYMANNSDPAPQSIGIGKEGSETTDVANAKNQESSTELPLPGVQEPSNTSRNSADLAAPAVQNSNTNQNIPAQEIPGPPQNGSEQKIPVPLSQVYPNIKPSSNTTSLKDTLNNLKNTQSSTTEDIVDRNAYFQKLSEQLNKLQGGASTDSNGAPTDADSKTEDDQANDTQFPVEEIDDFNPDEPPAPGSAQDTNPYSDLNNIPPPKIVE